MSRLRLLAAVATMGIVTIAAAPAFASTIVQPPAGFTAPLSSDGTHVVAFTIKATGYTQGQAVNADICDGNPPTIPGWDPTVNCDSGTAVRTKNAVADGSVTWDPTQPQQNIGVFDGAAPTSPFNCLYPGEPDPGNGNPSYTNCQIKVSTQNDLPTTDQSFRTFTLPKPTPVVPETHYVILLPLGALVLFGGGYLAVRRRNGHSSPAAA